MTESEERQKRNFKSETKVCEYAPDAQALYDIGVGPKTEYLNIRKVLPQIRLFGCEPDSRQYEAIKENFPGTVWPVAISTQPEKTLHILSDVKQSSCLPISKATGQMQVKAWTLDRFDEECGNPSNIILWMDIEGSELDALKSGHDLLSSGRVDAINLEVREDVPVEGWCTASEIKVFLSQYKYHPALKYNNQRSHWDVIFTRKG